MDLVKESRKILDSAGLLSKKSEPDKSPNFIGNKAATKIALETSLFVNSKTLFISESTALDSLRVYTIKKKGKVIYYDREKDKICQIDKIRRNSKGDVSSFYGNGKSFRGTIDLVCFMGLFFSIEEGVVIYDKNEFGKELDYLSKNMMVNSNTEFLVMTHDKLSDHINSEHFMNTDNYVRANLIITPTNIYQYDSF